MRVTALTVKNLLGIEELRLEPGQVTRISGQNGTGKSSVLAALQAAIKGGNLCNLKRVGSEEDPEVVLVLDDGRYRVERKGGDTVVKERVGSTAAYEKVRKPQAWLDGLYDEFGANPLTFLNARPMDRADILLDVLPLQLDRDALRATVAEAWPEGKEIPDGHPLRVLADVRTVLFDERTGVNRSQKDKERSAYELNKALPAELPEDPGADLVKAAGARDAVFRKLAQKKADAEKAEEQAKSKATADYEQISTRVGGEFKAAAAKLRTALAEKVAALEKQIALAKAETETAIQAERDKGQAILAEADAALEQADAAAVAARQAALDEVEAMRPELQDAERRVAEMTALSKNVAQLQEQKRLADRFEKESADLKDVADRLTKALDAVDVFKAALLNDLPIEGLEIRGKEIFVGGIAFDGLNHAQRIKIAVQVAKLRAKTQVLPVVFVDGAESLDPELERLLEEELVAAGVQAFVARREDGDLRIETTPAEAQKVTKMPPQPSTSRRRASSLTE